jgi:predicted nucleotidyltransferase
MRLNSIDYSNECYGKTKVPGFSQAASYSKKDNLKKGLYLSFTSLAFYSLYNSIHYVGKDYDAIIKDGITGERIVRKEEGWFFTKPFIDKVLIVHERYGNTTLEGMLDELMNVKKLRDATQSYHIKLMSDSDLERELETLNPYMAKHFLYVIKPFIKFEEIENLSGYYDPGKNLIAINRIYAVGGARENDPIVYSVIVHEDVHSQGVFNETSTQVITVEVCAEIAPQLKRYEAALFSELEEMLYGGSYLRAKEENRLAYWLMRIERIYKGMVPPHFGKLEEIDQKALEEYFLLPYVKIKLAMAEDNIVYDLPDYDIEKNPEGGYFKIDDLSKLLKNIENPKSTSSLESSLIIYPVIEYGMKRTSGKSETQ